MLFSYNFLLLHIPILDFISAQIIKIYTYQILYEGSFILQNTYFSSVL